MMRHECYGLLLQFLSQNLFVHNHQFAEKNICNGGVVNFVAWGVARNPVRF